MKTIPAIRPAKPEDARVMARVHVDTWRTTYAGIVPDNHLANLSYERCEAKWIEHLSDSENGERTFVVEDQPGKVVGFVSGGPLKEPLENFDAEVYVLYILKAFQGKGYGRLLVTRVAKVLKDEGYHSLVIWVLKENPFCRFYERLGGKLAGEKVVEIGGKELVDVAYVWRDLSIFAKEK